MIQTVVHCGSSCGRYVLADKALGEKWHVAVDSATSKSVYTCPRCRKAALQARVRSALNNGVRLGTKDLSPAEREAAAQVLGPELLETVDGGWGEERRETPPYGVPMGRAPPPINWNERLSALKMPTRQELTRKLYPEYRVGVDHGRAPDEASMMVLERLAADTYRLVEHFAPKTTTREDLDRVFGHLDGAGLTLPSYLSDDEKRRRVKEWAADPLFYELSVMYERCRAAAPDFCIVCHGPRAGSTFDAVWSDGTGWWTGASCFEVNPTWSDLKPLFAACLQRLEPPTQTQIRVRQVS